jgi:hypothetical protein
MWSSTVNRGGAGIPRWPVRPALALCLLLSGSVRGEGSALWSASCVTEPYFIGAAMHPAVHGAYKRDLGHPFRAQTRLSLSRETFGLFAPRRDPRAWDVSWSLLGGAVLPVWLGWLEASTGIGAVLGLSQGELYYRHEWSSGFFPERTNEYRSRRYLDVGLPFQAQWLFGRDQQGLGLEYSGFLSREAGRWGIGIFWQRYLGPAPPPKPAPRTARMAPPSPEPAGEKLEEEEEEPEQPEQPEKDHR